MIEWIAGRTSHGAGGREDDGLSESDELILGTMNMNISVGCADIGSVRKGNFGWALRDFPAPIQEVPGEASIGAFADALAQRLQHGHSVALGFECPLFVPIRSDPDELTRARIGEGNRPWSAGAGAGALVTGLVETVWLLSRLRERAGSVTTASLAWDEFLQTEGGLFLWEAFVSREAKTGSHHGDAAVAVEAFCRALPDPRRVNVIDEPRVFSLIGAALLRAGWGVPEATLSVPCIVVAA